jgi:peptidyl-prolyl isomerase D
VDLKEAAKIVPGDAGITKALKDAEARAKARKDKERAAYSKMFA